VTSDLLARSRAQAESCTPQVRAAALMRIARVQTATEPDQARQTFELGMEEARQLSGLDRQFILEQAEYLAAAVAPDLLSGIFRADQGFRRKYHAETVGNIMLKHGHAGAAMEYVMKYDDPASFPFCFGHALLRSLSDPENQLAVMRRTVEAWRTNPDQVFIHEFKSDWKVLPPGEALALAREIVHSTIEQADQQVNMSFDNGRVQLTSRREFTMFEVLHVLRHLDGGLAESLIARFQELAAAARRYPYGWETIIEEAKAHAKQASGKSCEGGGWGFGAASEDVAYQRALFAASRSGDFAVPIEHALERFREDTAPDNSNEAPREFWPSTARFRSILHHAGMRLGDGAAVYLDRVPDADLRLFAQIEFAAALAGLPELPGTTRCRRRPSQSRARR
jgi:hypothetical protein